MGTYFCQGQIVKILFYTRSIHPYCIITDTSYQIYILLVQNYENFVKKHNLSNYNVSICPRDFSVDLKNDYFTVLTPRRESFNMLVARRTSLIKMADEISEKTADSCVANSDQIISSETSEKPRVYYFTEEKNVTKLERKVSSKLFNVKNLTAESFLDYNELFYIKSFINIKEKEGSVFKLHEKISRSVLIPPYINKKSLIKYMSALEVLQVKLLICVD